VVAITLAGFWFKTKHWVLNNGFGIAFCIQGLERISLGKYKVGAILLTGLFFYDIFWVFGTEVRRRRREAAIPWRRLSVRRLRYDRPSTQYQYVDDRLLVHAAA